MDELVKSLRICEGACNKECVLYNSVQVDGDTCQNRLCAMAADAIEELTTNYDAAIDIMKHQTEYIEELSKPRWIPVTERLPETGVDVLVMFPHNMAVASRDMGEWVVNSGDGWCTDVNLSDDEKEPTHWMLLPETPKEE